MLVSLGDYQREASEESKIHPVSEKLTGCSGKGMYSQRGRMAQAAEVPLGGTLTSDTAVVTLISAGSTQGISFR